MIRDLLFGVEGEAATALTFDAEPPFADEGAPLAVAGGERLEDVGQAFVWDF